jgi:hypothetical protein
VLTALGPRSGCFKLPGRGRSGRGGRISNGEYSRYVYGGPSGLRARTVRVCAEQVLFAHNGWNLVGDYK